MIRLKQFSIFVLLLLSCWGIIAQPAPIQVAGYVGFGNAEEPARAYPVWIYANQERITVFTNGDGVFEATLNVLPDDAGFQRITVEVFDLCTGIAQTDTREGLLGDANYQNFRFTVCENINLPDTVGCGAFFSYESAPDNFQTIQFQNLSYSSSPITSLQWDFGDGETSDAINPVHTYDISGVYTVRLEFAATSSDGEICNSRYATTLAVNDSIPNNCPTIIDPVCVATPSGGFIRFTNRCRALEQGFTDAMLVDCVDDCFCPPIVDPVCVPLPDGTVRRFNNRCEAACAGFGTADFLDCEGGICPTVFEPVCVVVNGDTLTYTNACYATEAGFAEEDFVQCNECLGICDTFLGPPVCVLLADGGIQRFDNECVARCKGFTSDDFIDCSAACICPEYLDPVCVVIGQDTLNFDNPCFAECAGYDSTQYFFCDPDRSCDCPTDEYDPVCVILPNGIVKEYVSACWAECDGYTRDQFVDCNNNCVCPEYYDPVCVIVGQDTLRFSNPCFAECEGYGPDQYFSCRGNTDCGCPRIYEPVCVKIDGEIIEFSNECVAICNGYAPDQFVDCDSSGCICPEYYDPVCAVVNGDTLTFDNICFARCEGFTSDQLFTCNPQVDCVCTLEYDPVCVIGPNGDVIEFSNKCFAECEGYTEADFVDCSSDPNQNCKADFKIALENLSNRTFQFVDSSYTRMDSIISWEWDFGDGEVGAGAIVRHEYREPGLYLVNLTITTIAGCSASTVSELFISDDGIAQGPECQAMFLFRQDANNPRTFAFEDLSLGEAIAWEWNFGDGTTSTEQNPTHTFGYDGVFYVQLVMRTSVCTSRTNMIVYVDPTAVYDNECNALFIPFVFADSLQIFFRNMSSADAVAYAWEFGDGTTSTARNPEHMYAQTGIYEIRLTITTANGCTNTFEATINLASQNFTGAPAFREVTTSTTEALAFEAFRLYPNPVNETLRLEFTMPKATDYQLSIYTLEGKTLRTSSHDAISGTNNIQLAVGELPPGMYLLRIQSHEHAKVVKFVKQ